MVGVRRGRQTRILCINCKICVNSLRRYKALELDTRVTTFFCTWVYPQIITEEHYVCKPCRDLAMSRVDHEKQQKVSSSNNRQPKSSHKGHTNVCLLCGTSILKSRSHKILREDPSKLQQTIINILECRLSPQQITVSDRVCRICWLRTQREAQQCNNTDAIRFLPSSTNPAHAEYQEDVQLSGLNLSKPSANRQADQRIVLQNYRRAANTKRHCVYPNCSSTKYFGISDKLRAIVLCDHKYYLPRQSQICSEHLASYSWDTLYHSENSMKTFSAQQVEHIFSFINPSHPKLDFENVQEMDDNIFEYWLGLTKENFGKLLQEVSLIKQIKRGRSGLAALLLKIKTGDSNYRISNLFDIPHEMLESLMHRVRKALVQKSLAIKRLSNVEPCQNKSDTLSSLN